MAGRVQKAPGGLDGVRALQEQALQPRVRGKDAAEQFAVAARDVDHGGPVRRRGEDGVGGQRVEHP